MSRDDVIENLEQQIRWIEEIECHKFPGWKNVTDAMRCAIYLLKEQEPAVPGLLQDLEGIWSTCPRCESKLWMFFGMTININPDHMPKYCPQCGKPIKWGKKNDNPD